ncbi:MAG: 50S ribosomal protein L14e [Candidatus Bathyarchaeia archaeon]
MPAIEVGRVCVKLRGRESGKKCVVVDIKGRNFALVTGPKKLTGVKRRRVNLNHIEPMDLKVKIKRGASDREVLKALKGAGITDQLKSPLKPQVKGIHEHRSVGS